MTEPLLRDALESAGLSSSEATAKSGRLTRLTADLVREGHARSSVRRWFVPGRIEVLGKHTDYAGGRTLTCATERGFCLVAAPRHDGRIVVTDVHRGSTLSTALAPDGPPAEARWFHYTLTVIRRLSRNFPDASTGADIRLASDLPSASGISSSSALMVAVALALVDVNQIALDERWRQAIGSAEDMAAYFASIENGQGFGRLTGDQGVGTAGGSEDHTAILCSTAGSLGQFRFCPTRRERSVVLPGDLTFIVGCSGIAARKTGEALAQYNRASRAAGRLLSLWCRATGRADRSLSDALASAPEASARIRAEAAEARDEEFSATDLTERLDHFIEESEVLVPQASESLARGDMGRLSEIAARSQHIAEHWLRNQVPQTVALARTARESGAIAASAFGAGFGGSVWALVERSRARTVIERWSRAYAEAFPDAASRATFFVTRPGPAALDVDRA